MKFTVKRNQWLRGEGSGPSRLLRPSDNKMCCLGFLAYELGYSKNQIMDIGGPHIMTDMSLWPKNMILEKTEKWFAKPTDYLYHVMKLNDSEDLSDLERENCLKSAFKEHFDIDVEFED